ncbi:hypothetical protein AMST5_01499 [freshwater sediment metagenome]|uniref:Uncharacterized protein n=1 Tax=freshwater sediment metagenome TaxID=556182 RepID=A0AA48LYI2_9ZZZZ
MEWLTSIGQTPVPTILVVSGVVFLFFSLGGQLGAQIITDKIKPKAALVTGIFLLITGIVMYGPKTDAIKGVATPKSQVFRAPKVGNIPLDWCLYFAEKCGEPAASAFCRSQGLATSSDFLQGHPVPETKVIGDGGLCQAGKNNSVCDTFAEVTCVAQ